MPRPLKKEINLSKESILSLMQEIYNELVEQRNTAIRIQNKMLTMMKEPEDMTLIGPVIEKQQKIINDCVEKKLSLSKLQASIWEKTKMPILKKNRHYLNLVLKFKFWYKKYSRIHFCHYRTGHDFLLRSQ
jgi:hypothetical protein